MPDDTLIIPVVDDRQTPPVIDTPGGSPPFDTPPLPAGPKDDQPRRKRRFIRVAAVTLGVLTVGLLLWIVLSVSLLSGAVERIAATDLSSLDAAGAGPTNYLLVGTDSREDLSPELGNFFGDFGGERADVIMLLHVHEGRLQMVSLPRDLRVEIPGRGTDRINAAYAYGGPDLLVATVKAATGLPIHHYLEVRFGDFAGVVDALGGVPIEFANDARDAKSGLAVTAGTTSLNGAQAVSYVRSRQFEELRDGTWVSVDPGDIARTARQQQVVDLLLDSATRPSRLPTLPFVTRALGKSLRADEGLSMGTLLRLGWAVTRAGTTETGTLPSQDAPAGGVSYLAPLQPAADELLAAFGAGRPLAPAA
jgi:LCP family protein required for cell wall assembly